MKTVIYFKMPFKTRHFNLNQKVWVQVTTGAMAAKVTGKYGGKHRYISAWVNWDKANKKNPEFKEIDRADEFIKRHNLQVIL